MLVLLGAGHASYLLSSARPSTSRRCRIVAAEATCDVICVGAGVPKRGMGWYHAKQILDGDTPSASLSAVVEPWFLGPGADSPPGATFAAWAAETGPSGVAFCESVADVPKPDGPRMALISGRTADNPRLLREVIEASPELSKLSEGREVSFVHGSFLDVEAVGAFDLGHEIDKVGTSIGPGLVADNAVCARAKVFGG